MKKFSPKYLVALFMLGGAVAAMAVKAKPGVIDYVQADGSVVQIMLHGDEHRHFATNLKGQLLRMNEKGCFEPAEAQETVRYVRQADGVIEGRGGEPKYRYTESAFPTTGEPHSLVILVEYPDFRFKEENPIDYFNDFLNGENFSRDGGTGSCREYYTENSFGAFSPTFDLYGPVMMKNNRRYYGGGNEEKAPEMVVEAVEALDATVDFSIYDHNDDGYVDSVYIIYADRGEADGGPRDSVWPFSWELEKDDIDLWADGVKFNTYGCSNELRADGTVDGIGTFTHEFGHVLGLPDLYNTVNTYDYSTPCDWSVMDSGNYSNNSRTPCNFSSFERYSLGWLSPKEIEAEGDYSLQNIADCNEAYIMTTFENPDEFYIMEYRMQTGWDRFLPGKGFLIWHIDFEQEAWDKNTPNNNSRHQLVSLVRADNSANTYSYHSDPFPGTKGITEFGNTTIPSLRSWADKDLRVTSINNIREEGDTGLFSVILGAGGNGVEAPSAENDFVVSGGVLTVTEGTFDIFDVAGRKAGKAAPGYPVKLGKGIYFVGGKKIFVK